MDRNCRRGEAIVLMLAAMAAGVLVLWLATGRFHMMPGHGGERGMHTRDSSPMAGGPEKGSPVDSSGGQPESASVHGVRMPGPVHWDGRDAAPDPEEIPGKTSGLGLEEKS